MSEYTFFLLFKAEDKTIQIEEPFMFDAFSHSMERKQNGFALDVCLFAENTSLYFTDSAYSQTDEYEDIDGTVMFNLSHGLKRIIDSYNEYGPDGEVELSIYYNEQLLTRCDFDFENVDTDLKSYFKCGFIENNVRSMHKIREDVMIDVYADKDLDGRPIQKLVPFNVLLPSKSTLAISKWVKVDVPYSTSPTGVSNIIGAGSAFNIFNFCKTPIVDGIEDTMSPSAYEFANEFVDTYDGTMKMVDCKTRKKDVVFTITSDVKFKHIQNGRTGYANKSSLRLTLRISTGTGIYDSVKYVLYEQEFTGTQQQTGIVPNVITFNLPTTLNDGDFVTMFWEYNWDAGTIALNSDYSAIEQYSHLIFNDCTIEMQAVESVINSVIQGVRWIDLLKKSAQIISGLAVDAPTIDEGGEYYDTIISNGGGIRNISNIPFNVKTDEVFEMAQMVAHDYQITTDRILVGEYTDFFSGKLLRTFNVKPDEKFQWNTNKEYRIKSFDYKFKNYEQDRQEQRTLDAIHTEVQILLPTKKTVDTKKVEIVQILDSYKIDSLRRLGIDPETSDSSLSDDTDLVMLKVMPLPNSYMETYTASINAVTANNTLKLYSENFRWDKIGLGLSSSFEILSGANTGTYTVNKIENTILTLSNVNNISIVSERVIIDIRYSLEGVSFLAETDHKFSQVTGVISKETYTNLYYSKLRNIQKWLPYLSSCSIGFPAGNLNISFLKSNQDLFTRLIGETPGITEKNPIPVIDIAELRRVTNRTFSVSIYINQPSDILKIFNNMDIRNDDGTIAGYYGFLDNNGQVVYGYPEKLEYIPVENKIEAICLERYEPFNGVIELVDTDRDLYTQYTMFGVYVNLYGVNRKLLIKEKRFTKVKINGVLYTDLQMFLDNLGLFFS